MQGGITVNSVLLDDLSFYGIKIKSYYPILSPQTLDRTARSDLPIYANGVDANRCHIGSLLLDVL